MSALGERIASEAMALTGTPFRLGGRDPEFGLDCVGLVALALSRAMNTRLLRCPRGYALKNSQIAHHLPLAAEAGLLEAKGTIEAGDILHTLPGPGQDHLLIAIDEARFVHAHAGLKRVVISPGPLNDPIGHHWRAPQIEGHNSWLP